jgi:hypothetical protein
MATPPLGWIEPAARTKKQSDAHAAAMAKTVAFALAPAAPAGPVKVMLTDFWKDPDVVADVGGREFTGFRQLTGSCVGVSAGNAVFTLAAIQRKLADSPTKAFIPWWPYPYGRTRHNEGDRGQGEGAVDSVMGQTLIKEGVFGVEEIEGEPAYDASDGLALTSRQEYAYSDGNYAGNTKYLTLGKQHPVGAAAPLYSTQDIKTAILNGFPCLNGCSYYVGRGSLSGDVALGKYDGRGGHSTCYLGYWDHPSLGPLFLYSNQWDGSTYPRDGSGKARCTVWVKEADAAQLFRLGGDRGETMALSHLNYFPAQIDKVLDWSQI